MIHLIGLGKLMRVMIRGVPVLRAALWLATTITFGERYARSQVGPFMYHVRYLDRNDEKRKACSPMCTV